jgi:hypothetical protein
LSGSRAASLDASRKVPRRRPDEDVLTADIVALARQYGAFGCRRITALLRDAGWTVTPKRVERIWPGGAQGAAEATQVEEALAQRWALDPPQAGAFEPRLVIPLR